MNHGLLRCCDVGVHLYPESQHYAESARSLEAWETVVGVSTHQWQGSDPPFIPTLTVALSRQDQISLSGTVSPCLDIGCGR